MDSGDVSIDTPKRGIKLREKTINSFSLFPLKLVKTCFYCSFLFCNFFAKAEVRQKQQEGSARGPRDEEH